MLTLEDSRQTAPSNIQQHGSTWRGIVVDAHVWHVWGRALLAAAHLAEY